MTSPAREQLNRRRDRTRRIAHPLSDRMLVDIDGAPKPVHDSQAIAERAINDRIEITAKLREADATAESARARDAEAYKAARLADKPAPKSTVGAAEGEVGELRRRLDNARDFEAECLDRHTATMAAHAGDWLPSRVEVLRDKAAAYTEQGTLEAWRELDKAYTVVAFLHCLDPGDSSTVRVTSIRGLRDDDFDPEIALRRTLGLAEQAADRAQAGEPGYERHARAQAARAERRRQRLTAGAGQAA